MAMTLSRSSLDDAVIERARKAVNEDHRRSQESHKDGAQENVTDYKQSGCQVELTDMGLTSLPEALVDILKDHVRWLALNKNMLPGLSSIAPRVSEFTKLRYLNMRNNQVRDFPNEVLTVQTLEILDLRDNAIEILPEGLDQLKNLKKFSLVNNKITRIPTRVAHMPNLAYLMVGYNPVTFPPPELWRSTEPESKRDKEMQTQVDYQETKSLKKALADFAANGRFLGIPGEEGQSEPGVETPKPAKRYASGRFPIRPSTSSIDVVSIGRPDSPLTSRPPHASAVKSRNLRTTSSNRGQSTRPSFDANIQQSSTPVSDAALSNERNRSNSESQMVTSTRVKRMGLQMHKTSIDHMRKDPFNFFNSSSNNHNRGVSHGSLLQGGASTNGSIDGSSNSPSPTTEIEPPRSAFVSRLSSLPENRRKSHVNDPRMGLAQTIIFVIEQSRFSLEHISKTVRDFGTRRTLFEKAFNKLFARTEELSNQISSVHGDNDETEDEDHAVSPQTIQWGIEECLELFESLIFLMQEHLGQLIHLSNRRYIRSLLANSYSSIIELRNVYANYSAVMTQYGFAANGGFAFEHEESPGSRPTTSIRTGQRQDYAADAVRPGQRQHGWPPSSKLLPPVLDLPRTFSGTSISSIATRPAPSIDGDFVTRPTRSDTLKSVNNDDNSGFMGIYLALSQAVDSVLGACPTSETLLADQKRHLTSAAEAALCEDAIDKCHRTISLAIHLRQQMSVMRVEDGSAHDSDEFWHCTSSFASVWTSFAKVLKTLGGSGVVTDQIKLALRPVQYNVKQAMTAIRSSMWSQKLILAPSRKNSTPALPPFILPSSIPPVPPLVLNTKGVVSSANPSDPVSAVSAFSSHSSTLSSGGATPLPATPLSAALGHAAMATMPSTSQVLMGTVNGPHSLSTGLYHGAPGLERQKSLRKL